jgi:hypothetical protein
MADNKKNKRHCDVATRIGGEAGQGIRGRKTYHRSAGLEGTPLVEWLRKEEEI